MSVGFAPSWLPQFPCSPSRGSRRGSLSRAPSGAAVSPAFQKQLKVPFSPGEIGWDALSTRLVENFKKAFEAYLNFLFIDQYHRSRPDPQIYVDLIGTGTYCEFSPCFTELQKHFIVDRPTKLKNLIRLVKHWYKEVCCLKNWFVVPIYGIRFPCE